MTASTIFEAAVWLTVAGVFLALALSPLFRAHAACKSATAFVCSYCGRVMAGDPDTAVDISHGICDDCFKREMGQIKRPAVKP